MVNQERRSELELYRLSQQVESLASDLAASQAFAVGAVYINVTGVNPATELGYGTWSAFAAGRALVGYVAADPTYGTVEANVGSATHSHTYTEATLHGHLVGVYSGLPVLGGNRAFQGSDQNPDDEIEIDPSGSASSTTSSTSSLPPSVVVHFWKRTA